MKRCSTHKCAFIINDFLRNPHFKEIQIGSDQKTIKKDFSGFVVSDLVFWEQVGKNFEGSELMKK